jgi:predicted enzyme involved in methoxymalonyl-ACP biosynthesis
LLAIICEQVRQAGANALIGEYIETAKNSPAKDFYPRHGFKIDDQQDDGGSIRFRLMKETVVVAPRWIKMEVSDAPGRSSC